jgi:hypothetical protein
VRRNSAVAGRIFVVRALFFCELNKIDVQDLKGRVKIQDQLIKASGIERGLRQVETLSTTLFNFVLGRVITNYRPIRMEQFLTTRDSIRMQMMC